MHNKFFSILIITFLIVAFITGGNFPGTSIHAQDAPTATFTVGTGTPESCKQRAFRVAAKAAVNAGGGDINFNCGGAPHTIYLTKQVRFKGAGASFRINGGGLITLDGQKITRIFYFADNLRFTVENITLKNGRAASDASGSRSANQGAGIYSGFNNTLTISNVTFIANKAMGKTEGWHGGGALRIDDGSTAYIQNSTFIRNRANSGGAINNLLSRLTIVNSTFERNKSTDWRGGGGGAIYNDMGEMSISKSVFKANRAKLLGAGIYTWAQHANAFSGPVTITDSLITGNRITTAEGNGGGIYHGGENKLRIENSTLSNNIAGRNGGGLFGTNGSTFEILNSTFSGNRLPDRGVGAGITIADSTAVIKNSTIAYNFIGSNNGSSGAGITTWNSNFTLKNSIVAYNVGGWTNCAGPINNGGGNIQFHTDYPDTTCGSSILNANPRLAPLGNNGGTTPTHALLSNSKAISNGSNCLATDQRGVTRSTGSCDSGAFELAGSALGASPIGANVAESSTGILPLPPAND